MSVLLTNMSATAAVDAAPSVGSVVLSGLCIVFAMLLLFVIIFSIFGKIMNGIESLTLKKKAKAQEAALDAAASSIAQAENAPAVVICDDDDEIIAVIAAAVNSIYEGTGKKPVIRSIKPAVRGQRSSWATAGVHNNVRSF